MAARRDTRRIHRMIVDSYNTLLLERGSGRITVRDVIDRADISRGTFYAHFRDIPDLDEYVEQQTMDKLVSILSGISMEQETIGLTEAVDRILDFPFDNRDQLRILLNSSSGRAFIAKWENTVIRSFMSTETLSFLPQEEADIINGMLGSATARACIDWVGSDTPLPREELRTIICDMLSACLEKAYSSSI